MKVEPTPSIDSTRHLATVVAGDVTDDREAEPGAAGRPRPCPVDPVEPLEDAVEVTSGNADPGVGDRQGDPPVGDRLGRDDDLGVLG